jgi:hypothetical protein
MLLVKIRFQAVESVQDKADYLLPKMEKINVDCQKVMGGLKV